MIFQSKPHFDIVSLKTGLMLENRFKKVYEDYKGHLPHLECIFTPGISAIRNDMLTVPDDDIGIIVDVSPIVLPFLIIKKAIFQNYIPEYLYFIGFNGPEDIAMMWKLSWE